MKLKTIIIPLLLVNILCGCITSEPTRERIEWSRFWWENEPDDSKQRVLFIGNSITAGYFTAASKLLSDKVNCDMYANSRSIADQALFRETKIAMGKYKHGVIHFNSGLHGWHLTSEQYRDGMEKYVQFLKRRKSRGCRLVYSLTTPVPSEKEGQKLDPLKNQVVLDRNRIAGEIMQKNGIPVIDLYGLMEPELEKYSASKGNVHFSSAGSQRLAEKIAGEIVTLLSE